MYCLFINATLVPRQVAAGLSCSCWHSNGTIVFGTTKGKVLVCRLNAATNDWWMINGEESGSGSSHPSPVEHVSISADGVKFVTTNAGGCVTVWEVQASRRRGTHMQVCCAVSVCCKRGLYLCAVIVCFGRVLTPPPLSLSLQPSRAIATLRLSSDQMGFASGPLAGHHRPSRAYQACFYPSFDLLGEQHHLAVGFTTGDVLRFRVDKETTPTFPTAMQGNLFFTSQLGCGLSAEILRPSTMSELVALSICQGRSVVTMSKVVLTRAGFCTPFIAVFSA